MVLNKREKYLGIGVAVALGCLLLDSLVLSPWLASLDAGARCGCRGDPGDPKWARYDRAEASPDGHMESNSSAWFARQRLGGRKPNAARGGGLESIGRGHADFTQIRTAHAGRSVPGDRRRGYARWIDGGGFAVYLGFGKVTYSLAHQRTEIEFPKEGTDDLLLTISLSTLCMPDVQDKPAKAGGGGPVADAGGGTR